MKQLQHAFTLSGMGILAIQGGRQLREKLFRVGDQGARQIFFQGLERKAAGILILLQVGNKVDDRPVEKQIINDHTGNVRDQNTALTEQLIEGCLMLLQPLVIYNQEIAELKVFGGLSHGMRFDYGKAALFFQENI